MPTTYKGTNGVDIVHQNNNNDYFNIYTYGADDKVYLTLNNTLVKTGNGNDYVKSSIENNNDIHLGDGNDTYIGNGFSHNDNRYDRVWGDDGNDTITVATAVSEYYGGSGNDTFDSAGYWNYFDGGSGKDTISYQRQDTDNFLSGRGVQVSLLNHSAITGGTREEALYSIENIIGSSAADTLAGNNGNNKIDGKNGYDRLIGHDGNDRLSGGNNGDNLYGDSGNDWLYGGRGVDLLQGGSGSDTFVFKTVKDSVVGSNRDVIDDFSHSQGDKIDVSDIGDFTFIGTNAFSHTAFELRFNEKHDVVQGDVNGDGKADFEIKVDGVNTLHAGDFIL